MTTFSPDTCGCTINYTADGSGKLSMAGIVKQCPLHVGMDAATHFAALMDEVPRKGKVVNQIQSLATNIANTDISWTYDSNRVLDVTCSILTVAQKNTLQKWADTNIGPGKVLFL